MKRFLSALGIAAVIAVPTVGFTQCGPPPGGQCADLHVGHVYQRPGTGASQTTIEHGRRTYCWGPEQLASNVRTWCEAEVQPWYPYWGHNPFTDGPDHCWLPWQNEDVQWGRYPW